MLLCYAELQEPEMTPHLMGILLKKHFSQ